MKRKLLLTLLTFVCAITCVFGLAACDDPAEKPSDEHTHSYRWVDNGDGTHKRHCDVVGCENPDIDFGHHTYDESGVCICGNIKQSETHTHEFTAKNTSREYLKSEATCTDYAEY